MLSVNLRVGRGKFEMLDDQIQGTCTARKCKKKPKNKNKQTNEQKMKKKTKKTTTTNPNSVSILTKYCFKN